MDIPKNEFKAALQGGRCQIGLWCTLGGASASEIAAGAGFDWLLLDTEHTPASDADILHQLQIVAAYPVSPVVRPAWNDKVMIKRLLDVGAQTILIPYVETAEEASMAVASVRYPPDGMRGVAGTTRAAGYGRVKSYMDHADEQMCVLVQIETPKGLENLETIARTQGVDGVFIGPADLGANLGLKGAEGKDELKSIIAKAIHRIAACEKPSGLLTLSESDAEFYRDQGAKFLAVGVDAALLASKTTELSKRFCG